VRITLKARNTITAASHTHPIHSGPSTVFTLEQNVSGAISELVRRVVAHGAEAQASKPLQ
jgi:hypothetical protein